MRLILRPALIGRELCPGRSTVIKNYPRMVVEFMNKSEFLTRLPVIAGVAALVGIAGCSTSGGSPNSYSVPSAATPFNTWQAVTPGQTINATGVSHQVTYAAGSDGNIQISGSGFLSTGGANFVGVYDNSANLTLLTLQSSLGFNVTAHRLAAHAFAGFLAAIGGILLVWYNNRISPGSINTGALINILVIAVLGGMKHPIGAFIGAIAFVLLQNFAIDLVDRQRFNLVIGSVFLLIVFFSPDGLLGLWQKLRVRWSSSSRDERTQGSRRS